MNARNAKTGPQQRLRPKVLLTDTTRWAISARIAIGLSQADCDVFVVCRTGTRC